MPAELTKNGVCYDLPTSPYAVRYGRYSFHFSTQRNADNFREKAAIRTDWLCDSLTRRFHYVVNASVLAIFQLYDQIEKRGFYVFDTVEGIEYDKGNRPAFYVVCGE